MEKYLSFSIKLPYIHRNQEDLKGNLCSSQYALANFINE